MCQHTNKSGENECQERRNSAEKNLVLILEPSTEDNETDSCKTNKENSKCTPCVNEDKEPLIEFYKN